MCDEKTLEEWEKYLKNKSPLSRRKFGVLTAGVGLAASLPSITNSQPQKITYGPVQVKTADGTADCYMAHPSGDSYPGVVLWPDILGLRPEFKAMAHRLAEAGYAVLVVNPFYRDAKAPVVSEGASFSDPAVRETVLPMAGSLNAETHFTDATAFVDYLDGHAAVLKDHKIGTIGYCMGGPMVMRTVAARPDRIGAAATFHGGGLVTEASDSPHLLIPEMKAEFLIAIAESDDMSDPEAKHTLRDSFSAAGLGAEIEVYEAAQHGWTVPGSTVYHEEQAERAWGQLLGLFDRALTPEV